MPVRGCRAKGRAGVGAVVCAALTSGGPHTVAGDSLSSERTTQAGPTVLASATANDQ